MYSINEAEQLTGIKAHTLRIWEKRYQSLVPHRTGTNIRYYDDDQLRRLLNVTTLLNHGYKISAVMGMDEATMNDLVVEVSRESGGTEAFDVYINNLTRSMLAFDEPSFDKVCSAAIIRYGMHEAMLQVVYPFLRNTGVLWSTCNAAPAQEHFASNIIKRKLLAAIDGIPYAQHSALKFILFLPPGEWHETGLLLCDFLLRNAGYDTVYLGQNVPHDSLEVALKKTGATHLLTHFTSGVDATDHVQVIADMAAKHGQPKILVGTNNPPEQEHGNIAFLQTPGQIFDHT